MHASLVRIGNSRGVRLPKAVIEAAGLKEDLDLEVRDGAVVIRGQRIIAAGCLFPLTDNPHFSTEMGTRHRAGIGITEESDAVVIIISEQTGQVSLAIKGAIQQDLEERALRRALEDIAAEGLVSGQ